MKRTVPSRLDFISEVRIDPLSSLPKQRQVYEGLRGAIVEGKLSADDELPSTRELARELGVARNTVLVAYEMLEAEGYITSRGGAGTFVAREPMASRPLGAATSTEPRSLSAMANMLRVSRLVAPSEVARPFRPSSPSLDAFPYAGWSQIAASVLRRAAPCWMSDGEPLGLRSLRQAIARHIHAFRSSPCDPDQIVITAGAQGALYLCSALLLDRDDAVWMEDPGYQPARLAFRARTERVIPVPVDQSGIDVETGKALSPQPRLIFTTPLHHWPLGITMSGERRRELIDFAVERGVWIIEDDYSGDLRFERKTYTALRTLDTADRVIHVGSFAKSLSPGIRIGFLVVPPDLVDVFTAGQQAVYRYVNPIAQAILAEFIESGAYSRHVYEMQMLYLERHELLRARITSKLSGFLEARASTGGTFTVSELVTGIDDVALAAAFERHAYESLPLSSMYAGSSGKRGLLLGHAVTKPEEIRAGVDTLERIAASPLSSIPPR